MAQITKDTIMADILDMDIETVPIFLAQGMSCLGCPSSQNETVESACRKHGVDLDRLIHEVNDFFAQKAATV